MQDSQSKMGLSHWISELFKGVLPNPYVFGATFLAFILLFVIVTFLVYKPTKKFLEEKRAFLQQHIDSTIANNKKSLELEKQKNIELQEAQKIKAEIFEKAQQEANQILEQSVKQAHLTASQIVSDGRKSVEQMEANFLARNKKDVLDSAFFIATKFLGSKVEYNEEVQQELINQLEKEMEA